MTKAYSPLMRTNTKCTWGTEDQKMIKPKGKCCQGMVSDFIDEFHGFLAVSVSEQEKVKQFDPEIWKHALEFLDIGESEVGYQTRDKFVAQMEKSHNYCKSEVPKVCGLVPCVGI